MQNKRIRLPLFWKFAIVSTFVVIIFGLINIYLLWTSVYTSFEKEIDKRCKVLAGIVAEKVLTPMVYDNTLSLYNVLNEIKQSDPSIAYIFLLNSQNKLIAQTYDINIPTSLLKVNQLNSEEYNIQVINTDNYKYPIIRDIAFPILKGSVGTVRLGIVEEHIQQELTDATWNMILMIIIFFIFGLGGALFFSYIITSPIKKISRKAQIIDLNKIGLDEDYTKTNRFFKHFFSLQINDELDELETKFSEMLARLKNSYHELKEMQSTLVQTERLASLGTLSAGVAHEINNPISGIKNCTNRMAKDPSNIEQNTKYILLIQEATSRIENVVQHLLNFSRKQDILLQKTKLNTVIENAIKLTDHKLSDRQITVKCQCQKDYFVNASANHLEQIFVNLILNSYDAILDRKEKDLQLKGEIEITINPIADKVYIHFKDNGIGIPKSSQDKIFDPFFTLKKVGKGTGLGLSVSFNLIKEHHGTISFSSTVGDGTEFIIELPCSKNNML